MKVTIKDLDIVDRHRLFFIPAEMVIDGVKYLVYRSETTVNDNGTLTIEVVASEDWIAAKEKEDGDQQ